MKKNNIFMIVCVLLIVVMIIIIVVKKNSKNSLDENLNNTNLRSESIDNTTKIDYTKELEDNVKVNINTRLNETKRVDNLEIGKLKLTNNNGTSLLIASVTNKGTSVTKLTLLEITLYDKNNNVLTKLNGLVDSLQPGESTSLNIGVTADYANAYDFTVEKK